ncbi:MAG TPA: hypothetical protein VLJ58_21430 [Ramlibacter sp.]|nr:hypothetical protein [Ramlibacter sp.]
MPRVPTVSGPSIASQPLTGGFDRSNPQPIVNRQLGEFSRALFEVGNAIQERQDADLVMRAETEIKGKYLEWEGEAKQRKGQQAWGIAKEAAGWWDEQTSKVSEGLENPLQKRVFTSTIAKLKMQSVGAFSGYEAGERRASLTESAQASIVGSINLAAANPGNPEVLKSSKLDVLKRGDILAQLNGWDPAIKEAKQAEHLTNFHKQVIQGLVRDNPAEAKAYFDANKAEIEGSQQAEVGAFATKATATRVGESTADAVWQTAGPKSDRDPVTLDVMEQRLRKDLAGNDDAIKVGIAGLRERAAAFKDSRRERDDQLEAGVNQAILDGKSPREIRGMPAFLQLSPESARKIADFMDNRALRAEQTAAARESRAATAEARQQTALQRRGTAAYLVYSNPDTLNGMSESQVLNLLPDLGNELTSHLMQQKRALAANPSKLAEARVDQDDFNQVAQDMGLRPFAAKSEDEKAALGSLKFRVEQLVATAQQGGKKVLSRDEKLGLMRQELARRVTVDGTWSFAKDVPVIALRAEDIKDVVVPTANRREIAEQMRTMFQQTNDSRFAPTEDNLKRWYLKGKSPAAGMIPNAR